MAPVLMVKSYLEFRSTTAIYLEFRRDIHNDVNRVKSEALLPKIRIDLLWDAVTLLRPKKTNKKKKVAQQRRQLRVCR